MMLLLLPRLAVFATLAACCASLEAAPITFFAEDLNGNPLSRISFPNAAGARASFLSKFSASATDTLEEFAQGDNLPLVLAFSGKATATLNGTAGSAFIQSVPSGTDGFGRFPTSGNNFLFSNLASLSITFGSPITSFGFYATDVGDFGGQLSLLFTRPGGGIATFVVPNTIGTGRGSPQDGSVLFAGYIDAANPFISVQILNAVPSDSFGFDDPVIGIAQPSGVPEPFSSLSCGAGLFALIIMRKQYCGNPAPSIL